MYARSICSGLLDPGQRFRQLSHNRRRRSLEELHRHSSRIGRARAQLMTYGYVSQFIETQLAKRSYFDRDHQCTTHYDAK